MDSEGLGFVLFFKSDLNWHLIVIRVIGSTVNDLNPFKMQVFVKSTGKHSICYIVSVLKDSAGFSEALLRSGYRCGLWARIAG